MKAGKLAGGIWARSIRKMSNFLWVVGLSIWNMNLAERLLKIQWTDQTVKRSKAELSIMMEVLTASAPIPNSMRRIRRMPCVWDGSRDNATPPMPTTPSLCVSQDDTPSGGNYKWRDTYKWLIGVNRNQVLFLWNGWDKWEECTRGNFSGLRVFH